MCYINIKKLQNNLKKCLSYTILTEVNGAVCSHYPMKSQVAGKLSARRGGQFCPKSASEFPSGEQKQYNTASQGKAYQEIYPVLGLNGVQ